MYCVHPVNCIRDYRIDRYLTMYSIIQDNRNLGIVPSIDAMGFCSMSHTCSLSVRNSPFYPFYRCLTLSIHPSKIVIKTHNYFCSGGWRPPLISYSFYTYVFYCTPIHSPNFYTCVFLVYLGIFRNFLGKIFYWG